MSNNESNNNAQNNEQEEYAGGKIVQSINAGPWKFVILEKLPFWSLYTAHGPIVFDSLASDALKNMLKYPEVSADPSLHFAISVAVQRKELSSVRAAISAMAQREELASGNPYQSYGSPFAQPQPIQDFSSCQIPHYMQQHWLNTPRYQQQTPNQMFERPMVPNWVDPVQNDTKPMAPIAQNTENNVKSNKDKLRASLLNKIVERSLHIKEGTEIDLGHCVITYRSDIIAGCKWQLKAGVNIVMTCDDISYIIDYMVDNCSWQ